MSARKGTGRRRPAAPRSARRSRAGRTWLALGAGVVVAIVVAVLVTSGGGPGGEPAPPGSVTMSGICASYAKRVWSGAMAAATCHRGFGSGWNTSWR